MKIIIEKNYANNFFVENNSKEPKIVLIFPVTRNDYNSQFKWQSVIELVDESEIDSLIVIDKTSDSSATKYFLKNFDSASKNLYALPRSINELQFETLGEIKLDDNLWVMQLHDDDEWSGYLKLPEEVTHSGAYYSSFFIKNKSGKITKEESFSKPTRVQFVLIPSYVWNQFTLMIKDQGFYVASSLDGTLNQMAHLACAFIPIENFSYLYNNRNWEGQKSCRRSLIEVAKNAGWGHWASVDIALFNRLLDNLSSLVYVQGIAESKNIEATFLELISQFKPSIKRRVYGVVVLAALRVLKILSKFVLTRALRTRLEYRINSRLSREIFMNSTKKIEDLTELNTFIKKLIDKKMFKILESRFIFWSNAISNLDIRGGC